MATQSPRYGTKDRCGDRFEEPGVVADGRLNDQSERQAGSSLRRSGAADIEA